MAGIDYERYRLQEVMKGGTPVSKDTWYAHQSTVYNSIIQVAESKEVEYLQMLKATGQRLVFCADAAWSHRGYEANQCCWLLPECKTIDRSCLYHVCTTKVLLQYCESTG